MLEFNEDNFKEQVLDCKIPVLVEFYGVHCPPCRALLPILEKLSKEITWMRIGKIDVENYRISAKYDINAIPTLLIIKDGVVVRKMVGLRTEEDLRDCLENFK